MQNVLSNGITAAPDLETAVLNGLYELIERDAFLIHWMNRLPAHAPHRANAQGRPMPDLRDSLENKPLLDVRQTAALLNVSETWVRRHISALPVVRLGSMVRFDPLLLNRKIQGRTVAGNRLSPERTVPMDFRRYQRGSVKKRGKRGRQVWVGVWREDVDGTRRQRKKVLGTVAELPNLFDARACLDILIDRNPPRG